MRENSAAIAANRPSSKPGYQYNIFVRAHRRHDRINTQLGPSFEPPGRTSHVWDEVTAFSEEVRCMRLNKPN